MLITGRRATKVDGCSHRIVTSFYELHFFGEACFLLKGVLVFESNCALKTVTACVEWAADKIFKQKIVH